MAQAPYRAVRWRAVLWVAASLSLTACFRMLPGGVRCEAHGGPAWREYRSAHFLLDTDLDRPAALEVLTQLETIQAMEITALLGEVREIPGRLRVIVPADDWVYRDLAPSRRVEGYYMLGPLREATIVEGPSTLQFEPEVIAHELVHHFSSYFFPSQPSWFTEGLAEFVQTVANTNPKYRGSVGLIPAGMGALREVDQIPVKKLLGWVEDASGNIGLEELWSWVLYHWLWNNRPQQFADYQRRLSVSEDPDRAWNAAFPEFDAADDEKLARLDRLLERHRREGRFKFYPVTATADATSTDQPIASADVHMLLAGIRFLPKSQASDAYVAEAEEALREDPAQPLAVASVFQKDPLRLKEALRRSARARPGDWRAWVLLGSALKSDLDKAEREAAFRKAAELNPDSALAFHELSWLLATTGRAEDAFPFARRALDLDPANPRALTTLALVAAGLGSCEDAQKLSRLAKSLLPASSEEEVVRALHEVDRSCAPAPQPVRP